MANLGRREWGGEVEREKGKGGPTRWQEAGSYIEMASEKGLVRCGLKIIKNKEI